VADRHADVGARQDLAVLRPQGHAHAARVVDVDRLAHILEADSHAQALPGREAVAAAEHESVVAEVPFVVAGGVVAAHPVGPDPLEGDAEAVAAEPAREGGELETHASEALVVHQLGVRPAEQGERSRIPRRGGGVIDVGDHGVADGHGARARADLQEGEPVRCERRPGRSETEQNQDPPEPPDDAFAHRNLPRPPCPAANARAGPGGDSPGPAPILVTPDPAGQRAERARSRSPFPPPLRSRPPPSRSCPPRFPSWPPRLPSCPPRLRS